MKCFALVLAFILGYLLLDAQTITYEEVVYLKNGSIIRGVIIEQIPNVSIKIQTKDRNLFVFKMEDIEKISKEEINVGVKKQRQKEQLNVSTTIEIEEDNSFSKDRMKKRGFSNITEFGGAFGINYTQIEKYSPAMEVGAGEYLNKITTKEINYTDIGIFNSVNGYQFNKHIFLGVGTGAEFEFNQQRDNISIASIPLFVEFRTYLIATKATPFISIASGTNILDANTRYLKSLIDAKIYNAFGRSQFGLKLFLNKNMSWQVSLGYRVHFLSTRSQIQFTDITGNSGGVVTHRFREIRDYIEIRTGFTF